MQSISIHHLDNYSLGELYDSTNSVDVTVKYKTRKDGMTKTVESEYAMYVQKITLQTY